MTNKSNYTTSSSPHNYMTFDVVNGRFAMVMCTVLHNTYISVCLTPWALGQMFSIGIFYEYNMHILHMPDIFGGMDW